MSQAKKLVRAECDRMSLPVCIGALREAEAQIELALPRGNTARALFAVDAQALPSLVRSGRVTGNVFNRAGGGFEFIFDRPIKGAFRQIR